jgi:hypothetical protein
MPMNTAGAIALKQDAYVANLTAPDTATAIANLAAADVAAMQLLLSTMTITPLALASPSGPVTGVISGAEIS